MRRKIFSLYVVMDMSESMSWKDSTGEAKIRTAMEIVPGIIEIAEKNTAVAAALRVSVIGFNQTTSEIFEPSLPLVDRDGLELREWWRNSKESIYRNCSGQTYFSVMFEQLNRVIRRDQRQFDPNKYELYRPVVYLLTDGKPEGQCETSAAIESALSALRTEKDNVKAPAILAIGIGDDVNRNNIVQYAAGKLIRRWRHDAEKGKDVAEYSNGNYVRGNEAMAFVFKGDKTAYQLKSINRAVLQSVVNSIQERSENYSNSKLSVIGAGEPDFTRGFSMILDSNERL